MKHDLEKRYLEDYEIHTETIALTPVHYGSKLYTYVQEIEDAFIVPRKPIEIIKHSCTYFGSTYEGRVLGAQKLLNAAHKIPIVIDSATSLYFFPTAAATREDCYWISFELIVRHYRTEWNQSRIIFRQNKMIDFPCSYTIMKNQILRTSYLKTKLMQNVEEMLNRSTALVRTKYVSEGVERYKIKKSDITSV